MFGMKELKDQINITRTTVECPVKGCTEKVERQRNHFTREGKFKCPCHDIYISPSTFEYEKETDNLLWTDRNDLDLFNSIKKVKRESRMARDNSEDAVCWNIFRFLEKNKLICDLFRKLIGICEETMEIIYWPYSQSQDKTWDMLKKGRREFELKPSRGSEPDITLRGEKTLILIETKFCSNNDTTPYNLDVKDKYVSGGDEWWEKVFHSDFESVAVDDEKYQLSRFWLLGSWIAQQLDIDFQLVNITLSNQEKDIEKEFKPHIREDSSRMFTRITWEDIYEVIKNSSVPDEDKKQ